MKMKSFKTFFNENVNVKVAILPGGFKPPTKGHFNALKYILNKSDKGLIFIGKKERAGITPLQSQQIWEIYKKYLSKPVDVTISDISPLKSVYDYADTNTDVNIIVGAGDKDEDISRFNYFIKNADKYNYVDIIKIPIQSAGISGTKTRNLIQSDIDQAIEYFTPDEISLEDKSAIKSILLNK